MERGGSSSGGGGKKSKPYHECPICKNGFTSAQALGGHMNLHNRGRDRSSRRSGRDAPAAAAAGRAASPAYPPAPGTGGGSFGTYYAAPSDAVNQRELNLFGAAATQDHDLRLGLGVPGEWAPPAGEAETSLDLELRLGRHPGWQ